MKRLQLFMLMLMALSIRMLAAGTTWQTATLIENGGTETGSLSKNVTVQWFKIAVPEDGEATIQVTAGNGLDLNYTTMYAKDANNELHNRGNCWGSNNFTVKENAKGTYYIEVKRNGGEGSFTISYSFKATSSDYANDSEPNDTYPQANTISNGTEKTGHLGYYYWDDRDVVDWYKIVVPENGTVKVTVIAHGDLDLNYTTLYALDANNELHNRGNCWGGNDNNNGIVTVPSCARGTYYLEIKRNGGQGGYTVKYDFTPTSSTYPNDPEPNDTYEGASLLKNGAETTGHLGYYYWDDMDIVDWHKIVVPENGTIKVTIIAHGDLDLNYTTLYALDANNELHNRGNCWGGNETVNGELTVPSCAPGTYYLETKRNGGQGGYTVKYDFTPTSSTYPNDPEPNDTYEGASLLTNGAETTGHLGYYYWDDMDVVDWHKIIVPENGTVKVTVIAHGNLDLNYTTLYALDANNDLHSRGNCWGGNEAVNGVFTVTSCARGTYYLETKRNGGQGGYTIKYDFTPTSLEYPDDKEPNNTWQTAKLLKRGNTTTGHLGYYYWDDRDDVDWHKIEVPRDGIIKLSITPHGDLNLNYTTIYAVDANNEVHSRGDCWGGSEITVVNAAPGTYYIETKRNGGEGAYSLTYKFEQNIYATDTEPNNDKASALSLAKDATMAGHLGYFYYNDRDDVDWYKLTVSNNSTVTITYQAAEGLDFNYVTLYDNESHNKANAWGNGTNNINSITAKDLDAGTYYLEIKRNGGQGYYLVSYASTIGNVDKQDVLPDEEPDDPDNPDNPDIDISGPNKDFIDNVGKDLLDQWDADSYRNVLGLLQQSMSYDTKKISEWGAEALKAMKTAITTPYNGISNGYMLMVRAATFTGHFRAVNNHWKYEGPADDLQFIFADQAGTPCVARIVTSGDSKTVKIPYEFDEDEDDEDSGLFNIGGVDELTKDVKLIAIEVPEHFEISFTHGSTQLMLTTVDFDLSCFTEDWNPTTNGLIVSINSTFAKSGATTRAEAGTFEMSMNRVGYMPGTGINFSFTAKNDGKQIIALDLKAPGTLNLEDGIIDIDPETGVTFKNIGIKSVNLDLDVMGRIQAHGSISDVTTFVNTLSSASNCKDGAEAQQIMSKLDDMMDGSFYYDNGTEAQGSLGLDLVYNEEKEEWTLEPIISFTSDNSSYPITTYFSEKNFPEFVGGVQTILNELREVATTLIQNVEKMEEEAAGIKNLPMAESSDAKAKIYTIGGRAVTSSSTLPSGVYIIKTSAGTRKFIKK